MAEKRYSREDQQKMLRDKMQDMNAKGADFRDVWVTHPDGTMGLIKELKKEPGYMVDQSQEQTEKNRNEARHINDPKEPAE
jgi:hypothetical protein